MNRPSNILFRWSAPAGLALLILLCGCGSEPETAAKTAPKTKSAAGKAEVADESVADGTNLVAKSVFMTEGNLRDPFFPNSARNARPATAETAAPEPGAEDLASLLQAGLQGIIGTPEQRLAIVHNVILEPNRSTVIAVRHAGKVRNLSVRCREIQRDSVTLEVQGTSTAITLIRPSFKHL